ncbi:MAG: hypothetical protein Q7T41_01220, partial [Candidatus Saccharibacteria bacterium]|nr:hypothetical protein [Candidatus Saccharibacteria bacterium]
MKEITEFLKANKIFVLILVLLSVIVYGAILFNGFVSADDLDGYVNNQSLYNFRENVSKLYINPIIYSLFKITIGNNAAVLHLYSLLLHIINTVLVLVFVNTIFGKKIAAISSLLFAVHPLNTEAVAWFGGNSYLLNAILIFPTLILYSIFKKSGEKNYFICSVSFFVLSLIITRSVWLLVVPFIIGVLETFVFEKRVHPKSIVKICAYFIPGLILFFSLNALTYRTTELQTSFELDYTKAVPWLNRLPYTFFKGTELLIFPKDLSIFHEGEIISTAFYGFMIFTTLAVLATILLLTKKHRIIAGLLILIIVSIAPTLSPIQVAFFIAERYMYVGSVFFTTLIAIL